MRLKNILIVRTDRMGDVVLTTPVFKALRKSYPMAKISALVTPATFDLVQGNPYVDHVLVDDRKGKNKDFFGFLQLCRMIRRENFDAAVILHTKRRYNLSCYLAGVPLRVGFKNDKFGFLLTHPLKDERHKGLKHEAEYCLDVLKPLQVVPQGLDLFLPAQKEAEQWVVEFMKENDLNPYEIIAIHPGASDPTKCWPVSHFADLINRLRGRYSLKVIIIGGKETSDLAKEIVSLCNANVIDCTGKHSVSQTASLLRRSRILISNDSGPVHMGAASGINVISLFLRNQPGINPERWRPLGEKSFCLANNPGEEVLLDKNGKAHAGLAGSIGVDRVLDAVEAIFRKDNQSTFYF